MSVDICPAVGDNITQGVASGAQCRKSGAGMSMRPYIIVYIVTSLALSLLVSSIQVQQSSDWGCWWFPRNVKDDIFIVHM